MTTIKEALDKLPTDSAGDIAAFFQEQGIRQQHGRFVSKGCPIATFLQREVGDDSISVGCTTAGGRREDISNSLPPAAQDFVWRFGRGDYPELSR